MGHDWHCNASAEHMSEPVLVQSTGLSRDPMAMVLHPIECDYHHSCYGYILFIARPQEYPIEAIRLKITGVFSDSDKNTHVVLVVLVVPRTKLWYLHTRISYP